MKVDLNLNGKDVCLGGLGPQAKKVLDFVLNIPNGKYYDVNGIAECLKSTKGAVEQNLRKCLSELEGHYLFAPGQAGGARQLVYGSKAGIIDLKKRLKAADLI